MANGTFLWINAHSRYYSLMQKLGQHFLKNKAALQKIADALELREGDTVVEIGPGHGELTELLLTSAKKIAVTAIEKDRNFIAPLQEKFATEPTHGAFEVIEGDALKLLKGMPGNYKIAGNIPYYITGKLLRVLSELPQKPERTVLLVQREVAERICAKPPAMNRLAASVQFWAEPKIIGLVPKEQFSPPPKVDSAIVLLKTIVPAKKMDEADRYYAAVRALFAQPRKTILNNLSAVRDLDGKKADKRKITEDLQHLSVSPLNRPQNLSITDLSAIAKTFF